MDASFLVSQLAVPAAPRFPPGPAATSGGVQAAGPGPSLTPVPPADEAAVRRFDRALAGAAPVPASDAVSAARSAAGPRSGDDLAGPEDLSRGPGLSPDGAPETAARPTLGDAILNGLGALTNDLRRAWDGVRRVPLPTEAAAAQAQAGQPPALGGAESGAGAEGVEGASNAAAGRSANGMPPVGELLELQRSMVEFAFLFEAVGKGTSKAIDNTNQLVKMQ